MAKPIKVPEKDIETMVAEFKEHLVSDRNFGSVKYSKIFPVDARKATIVFSTEAWAKMTGLVHSFSTEVEWHGLVRRVADNIFYIYDVLVPPHEVGATTVTADYDDYRKWCDQLDDETFNNMRFHGHSHVNMAVSPSGVDMKYRTDLVTQLPDATKETDTFYLFLIFNKRHEWSGEIYDFTNNALYDTKDIDIEVQFADGSFSSAFIEEAKKLAVVATPKQTTVYNGGAGTNKSAYVKGKETKKSAKSSKFDDDDDDDIEDYYKKLSEKYGYDFNYGGYYN